MLALASVVLVAAQAATVQISSYSELKAQTTDKCISGTIDDDLTLNLTSDIEVEDTIRIPNAKNMVIRSAGGAKLKPKNSDMKVSLMTVGGLWCLKGLGTTENLTFENLEFADLQNLDGGIQAAAVHVGDFVDGSTVTFDNVKFTSIKCKSGFSPAALELKKGNITMKNCRFEGNENEGSYGGALKVGSEATVTIDDTVFKNNKGAGMGGGAVHLGAGDFFCNRCDFDGNEVGAGSKGAAIFGDSGSGIGKIRGWFVTFNACTFGSGQSVEWKDTPELVTWTCAIENQTVEYSSGVPTCKDPVPDDGTVISDAAQLVPSALMMALFGAAMP